VEYTLKDYQADAVSDVLANLRKARTIFHQLGDASQFALTATTGAGKTVMAAAAIEALFYGDEAFDFEPDPSAIVLWFSDDPSLNEQTRFRLMEASDKLVNSDLVIVQYPFSVEKLTPGKVYFLNTGKLTKSSLLTRGHDLDDDDAQFEELRSSTSPDLQAYTIWDTIGNTVDDPSLTLYMVLDEAHRGMGTKASVDKPTIVKRLINGHAGVPPMPVVWGISATVQRFEDAMKSAEVSANRIGLSKVLVDSVRVQESGLLKDDIVLDIPAESGKFDAVLLARATRKIVASTKAWAAYASEQGDKDPVVPLMVLQSPNTPDPDLLARALDTIFAEWPDLREEAIAHVLGDHSRQRWGRYEVPYISPERVQDAKYLRVLVAKDAISTGWDCPRAEVLMSFRPAKDATHITQLLGRMVRTPLARRIPGNEKLNSVECILPFFDHKTATDVVKVLMGAVEGLPDPGDGRRVLIDPQQMVANGVIPESVLEALETLPSQSLPKRGAKPVKRLTALAQALATDGLRPDAGKVAHAELHAVLDGCAVRYKDKVDDAITEVWTVHGETVKGRTGDSAPTYSDFAETADDRAIHDAFREASRVLSPDLAGTYVNHLAGPDVVKAVTDQPVGLEPHRLGRPGHVEVRPLVELGAGEPGAQCGRGDTGPFELVGQGLGEGGDPGLGRAIRARRDETGHRRHVDDVAAAPFPHRQGARMRQHQHRAAEDIQHGFLVGEVTLQEAPARGEAGVVDQQVDGAFAIGDTFGDAPQLSALGQVGGQDLDVDRVPGA